jgi:antibiotic biosynthesis monooxygenase (ABM) superfamily enzyme
VIFRIWHGWTTPTNAAAYERIVQEEVFAMIAAKKVQGYRGIDLLRRSVGGEVEFTTIMRFDSLDAVKAFAGNDYERSFVPPQAQAVLSRYDQRAQHYDHIRHIDYADGGTVPNG